MGCMLDDSCTVWWVVVDGLDVVVWVSVPCAPLCYGDHVPSAMWCWRWGRGVSHHWEVFCFGVGFAIYGTGLEHVSEI